MKTKLVVASILALSVVAVIAQDRSNLPVSKADQAKLTPDVVLKDLMDGNGRYVEGTLSDPNVKERVKVAVEGQFPKAFVLSCIDSRVPVEQVFDQGLGDIFVGRVAGNIENTDQLGSMEFAAKVAGVKLILVLGHEACGAVKGACDHVELGNITSLLANVKPAIAAVEGYTEETRNSKNKEFVDKVIAQNVAVTVKDIRERSEILAEMEKAGDLKIVGAVYSLKDGSVSLIE